MSTPTWEELVFEHLNKEYGAYVLRFIYPFHVLVIGGIVIFLFVAIMAGQVIFKEKQAAAEKQVKVINYTELAPPPPIEKVYVPPPVTNVQIQKQKKYVPPKATTEDVEEPEELLSFREVQEDVSTSEGDHVEKKEAVVVKAPEPVHVQKDPEFPGGKEKLMKWLSSHLTYPAMAQRMGVEGVVKVAFTVDVNGKIANVKIIQSANKMLEKEAIRLISSMPAWIPGEIDGVKSTTTYTIPIRFKLLK